jgi:hypothetical protein
LAECDFCDRRLSSDECIELGFGLHIDEAQLAIRTAHCNLRASWTPAGGSGMIAGFIETRGQCDSK